MDQTKREEFWNTLTHFIGIVLSLVGLPLLILANNNLSSFSLASILYLIAGSYAPVCLITLYNDSGIGVFIAVLAIMFIGTFFKLYYTGKYEKFSLVLYLAMGWLIIFKINTLTDLIEFNGLVLIVASGLLYTFGTFFYSSKTIKYSHAIWHLFVLGGSTTHFFFVLFFVV